jgi:rhomboid protease GluP
MSLLLLVLLFLLLIFLLALTLFLLADECCGETRVYMAAAKLFNADLRGAQPPAIKGADAEEEGCWHHMAEFVADFFGAMQFDEQEDPPKATARGEVKAPKTGAKKDKFRRVKRKPPPPGGKRKPRPPPPPPPPGPARDPVVAWEAKDEAADVEQAAREKEEDEESDDEFEIEWQLLPIFTVSETAIAFGIWFIMGQVTGSDSAGLESFAKDQTDLAVYGPYCKDLRFEIWRWWSYQFSHVGFSHVAMNSLVTLSFGIALEGFHGHLRLFVMFNIGIFGGACCFFVTDCHTRVVGMSGGCCALMGIYFSHVIMNFTEIKYPKAKLVMIMVMLVLVFAPSLMEAGKTGVSHSAHFGGVVAGVLGGIVIGKNKRLAYYERPMQIAAFIIGIASMIGCLWWLSMWAPRDIFSGTPWCWAGQVSDVTTFGDGAWHCVRCDSTTCIDKWNNMSRVAPVSAHACEQSPEGWKVSER